MKPNNLATAWGTKLKVSMYPLHEARTYQSLSDNAYCVEQQVLLAWKGFTNWKETEAEQYKKQALGSLENTKS